MVHVYVVRTICLAILIFVAQVGQRRVLERVPQLVDEGISQVDPGIRTGRKPRDQLHFESALLYIRSNIC